MRFIDADKVLIVLNELKKHRKQINIDTAIRAVAHTETTEAIPISFIREQIYKELEEEKRIQNEQGFMPRTFVSYAYASLIVKWEEENEQK